MKSSFRLIRIFEIDIEMHITFLLLFLILAVFAGFKGVILIASVFFCVTVHELSHSLVARYYGVHVGKITLMPIGGVAMMSELPKEPYQELAISLAGPLSNIIMAVSLYMPLDALLWNRSLVSTFSTIMSGTGIVGLTGFLAYIFWMNLILAGFNMIPAFPMDGGRVLRSILSFNMDFKKATDIAVRVGHIFALVFAYIGLVYGHIILLFIAVFVYNSATREKKIVEMLSGMGRV